MYITGLLGDVHVPMDENRNVRKNLFMLFVGRCNTLVISLFPLKH